MDAIIKIGLSELDASLVDRIKALYPNSDDIVLTITLADKRSRYFEALNRSKNDLESGRNLVSFTIEEFVRYSQKGTA